MYSKKISCKFRTCDVHIRVLVNFTIRNLEILLYTVYVIAKKYGILENV